MEVLRDFLARRYDIAHIGILGLAQRSWDANVDGIQIADHTEIGGGAKPPRFHQVRHIAGRDILYVRISGIDSRNFGLHQVDAVTEKPAVERIPRLGADPHIQDLQYPRVPCGLRSFLEGCRSGWLLR